MMQVSEYRVTMKHDGGTALIVVTASSAATAVDGVVRQEGAPRRSARLVEVRPLQFERGGDDAWTPVPGDQWGRVDDQPANVDVHSNPFAPDPRNPYKHHATTELTSMCRTVAYCVEHPETYADGTRVEESRIWLAEACEELARRADVDTAVELWERLCAVPFVRGETQGEYLYSTRHLDHSCTDQRGGGAVSRMPNREELYVLVLSDGEETLYPSHDVVESSGYVWHQDTSPWSYGLRLYPITITLISCGDYHGSDVDAANNRVLQGTPGVDVSEPNSGGMGSIFNVSTTVVGQMSSFENSQTTADWEREPAVRRADALMWLESLVEQMEGLIDYALLDDETHSKLVDELAGAAWDAWLESETFSDLRELAPEDGTTVWEDVLDNADSELKTSVHDTYYGYEENEWNVSSLGEGATNGRHTDAVHHVALHVFGWSV